MWWTLIACGPQTPDPPEPEPRVCHGDAALCDRPLTDVVLLATHNGMSNEDEGWALPNQHHDLDRQLADGVRGFLLDLYDEDGVVTLCHGFCELGSEPFVDALGRFSRFFDAHPGESVVFVLESYVSGDAVAGAFADAGLADRAWAQVPGDPWPTLGELADADRPFVVFGQDDLGGPDWVMDGYGDFVWDNPYAAEAPEDLSCAPYRGDPSHDFFLMNHFLTAPTAREDLAEQVNHDPFLSERVAACEDGAGRPISWLAVDFYDVGDGLSVVRRLNER